MSKFDEILKKSREVLRKNLNRDEQIEFLIRAKASLIEELRETGQSFEEAKNDPDVLLCELKIDKLKDSERRSADSSAAFRDRSLQPMSYPSYVKEDKLRRLGFGPPKSLQNTKEMDAAKKRTYGGSQYQRLLAMHYLLEYLKAKDNKSAKARFAAFLTGFSENTLYNDSFNVHAKQDSNGVKWEKDMELVKKLFADLGLDEIVRMIENDLEV